MNWDLPFNSTSIQDGHIQAMATFEQETTWFEGHFPGDPILPAIVQLALVSQLIRDHTKDSTDIKGFRRVRFRRLIRPDDELVIHIDRKDEKQGRYPFEIRVSGELACKGTLLTR